MTYPDTYVVWDLETTGLNPQKDKILEIGALKVVKGEKVSEHSWILNHKMEIPEVITQITGITKELVDAEGVDPTYAVNEFRSLFADMEIPHHVTHNGFNFDIHFLKCTTGNMSELFVKSAIDTAALYKGKKLKINLSENESFFSYAKRVFDVKAYGVKYSVHVACEELGIDMSGVTRHRALGDTILTNEIYKTLCLTNR
jgi:DNA polymerase III alpha subunit (gram-positive type)